MIIYYRVVIRTYKFFNLEICNNDQKRINFTFIFIYTQFTKMGFKWPQIYIAISISISNNNIYFCNKIDFIHMAMTTMIRAMSTAMNRIMTTVNRAVAAAVTATMTFGWLMSCWAQRRHIELDATVFRDRVAISRHVSMMMAHAAVSTMTRAHSFYFFFNVRRSRKINRIIFFMSLKTIHIILSFTFLK